MRTLQLFGRDLTGKSYRGNMQRAANLGCVLEFQNAGEFGLADGWAQIAPLGDFQGTAQSADGSRFTAIQRVDAAACSKMIAQFENSQGTRFQKGIPIFAGHADVPGRGLTDKSPKGVFSQLRCDAGRGLIGKVLLTPEGESFLSSGRRYALSARWNTDPAGQQGGLKVFRPVQLVSVALTQSPVLPVEYLNDKPPQQQQQQEGTAGPLFMREVRKIQASGAVDFDTAWREAQKSRPDLFNAMQQPPKLKIF